MKAEKQASKQCWRVFSRCPKNPLIKPADVKPSCSGFRVIGAFNPGAVKFGDETILLLRVAEECIPKPGKIRVPFYDFSDGSGEPGIKEFDESDHHLSLKDTRGILYQGKDYLSSLSHIRVARSKDGINFKVDEHPFIFPSSVEEEFGIEDARVCSIKGHYYINYTVVSRDGWSTALSLTDDFVSHERLGLIFCPQNKDVSIFELKNGKRFGALHRPNNAGFGKPSIWYAESDDLFHWGMHKCVARPRNGNIYEGLKIGGGSAPIETPEGLLTIYHGKDNNSRYGLFALLLDPDEPWKVLRRGDKPLLIPEQEYETDGFFPNVVFTNGNIVNGNTLHLYYGAADESCCLATAEINDILKTLS